jgi:hypothetical protein
MPEKTAIFSQSFKGAISRETLLERVVGFMRLPPKMEFPCLGLQALGEAYLEQTSSHVFRSARTR